MKRRMVILLILLMIVSPCGCSKENVSSKDEQVTLTIAGPWNDCDALELVATSFKAKYPNCNIVYEYIQNYEKNLPKRLASTENKVDLFLTNNIQKDSELLPFSLELSSLGNQLDLSNTYPGLVENFQIQSDDETEKNKIYAIPLGAEVRGMFVNLTLLDSLDIKVPTNQEEFLDACEKLSKAGYIPIQGNPGMFGQHFLYPYFCNLISNSSDYLSTYHIVNEKENGISELFLEPMELLYTMVEKRYYNYKYVETELGWFTDSSNEGYAKSFLGIKCKEDGKEEVSENGEIAFMPFTQSLINEIKQIKKDYHSNIEFSFILSPVGTDGGYAYMSPARGIAINKSGEQLDWTLKFLNYLLEEEPNSKFGNAMGFIPNTKDAFQIVTEQFNIPEDHISHVGQVTFDYDFYSIINCTLVEVAKANNPKYMSKDNRGNSVMHPFSYYMNRLEERFHEEGIKE